MSRVQAVIRRGPVPYGRALAPLLALVATIAPRPAAALDPAAPADEMVHTHWPSVARSAGVDALGSARAGHVWIGTSEDLVRFDGLRMTTVQGWPGAGLARVTAVFEAADGTTWVGTNTRGAARLRSGSLDPLPLAPQALPGPSVTAFAQTPDGTLWIAGARGVTRWSPDGTATATVDGLPHPAVQALAVDAHGTLWVGTQVGLGRWDGHRFQGVAGPQPARIQVLRFDDDGTLWAATRGAGLWERRGDAFRVHDNDGLEGDVAALLRDRAGHLWAGGRQGLFVWRDDRFRRVEWERPCAGTPGGVTALAEDAEGGLWVGTEQCGLHRLADRAFRTLRARDGLPLDSVLGLARAPDGTVWVGSRGGGVVQLRDGGPPQPVACDDPRACQTCWDFTLGAGGAWVVCRERIVLRGTGAKGEGLARVQPLPGGWNEAAYVGQTSDGALWLARNKKVLRVAGETTTVVTGQEPLEGRRLVVEGRGGVVWIVASDGVARWQGGNLELFRLPGAAFAAEVTTAYEDADGALWMGTLGAGVRRLWAGRLATISPEEGLPTGWIDQLLEDDHGRIWASSSKGIFWVERRALAEVAEGRRARVTATLYDASDGIEMRQDRFGHPAGFKDAAGRLWFATSGGIVTFDPAAAGGPPARAVIEDLRLGGRSTEPAVGPVALTATVAALGFAPPETVVFRHYLEGLDAGWVDSGTDRTVSYPQVPPGHYRLLAAARGRDGAWGPAVASATLVVRPPFHRTPGFALACAAALGLLAFGAHRLRVGRVRAGLQAAMGERARIAREIHDTLSQAFVAMSVQLECIDQAVADGDPALLRRHLDTARQVVKESLEEARRSVWVLRPQALNRGLVPAIGALVQRLSGDTVVTMDVTGSPRALPPAAEANLLRIAQEAVANAYRHAHARRIDVLLAYAPRTVTLSVRDDGAGVDAAATPLLSQGMLGLEERTAELGGRLTVDSAPAKGTTIRVEIPS